jgi:acetylserotonin N-methyltransferase
MEKLIHEDRRGPVWALMQSLNMLTLMDGKERTLTEYEVLLKRAGFGEVCGCRNTTPLDAILALKAWLFIDSKILMTKRPTTYWSP